MKSAGPAFGGIFSLVMTGIAYFLLMHAQTYWHFVGIMVMIGLSNPMYQVGADAMLADMIPSEKRTDAYAINRIANNAAFALGPAVGGFLAATSYNLAFIGASTGFLTYSMLLFVFARETLNKSAIRAEHVEHTVPQKGGFTRVLRDTNCAPGPVVIAFATVELAGFQAEVTCEDFGPETEGGGTVNTFRIVSTGCNLNPCSGVRTARTPRRPPPAPQR